MKRITPVNKPAGFLAWLAGAIILLLPFHALLTVWLSSVFGHYTLLRLWKEALLIPLTAGSIFYLLKDRRLSERFAGSWLIRLIFAYILLLVIGMVIPLATHNVSAKSAFYGLLVDSRFLVFFLAVLVLAAKSNRISKIWHKILLGPAALVAAFAVLQYLVLPYDFLKHLGYGDGTISPYETINHNINHLRVASTLRGANPLGAYLILPISAVAVLLIKEKRERLDKLVLGAGLLLALAFSFSRSAWIGMAIMIGVICWIGLEGRKARRLLAYGMTGLLVIAAIIVIIFHNSHTFQETFLHTETASTAKESSNYGHRAAMKSAFRDLVHHPLGSGIGTAGPQSVYNKHLPRIAEDYYLQIGQEVGIIGLALFLAIVAFCAKALYRIRSEPMALVLLASLAGISAVGLLSHVWADDTLAYIWWGLAGLCLGPVILTDRHKLKNGEKNKTA